MVFKNYTFNPRAFESINNLILFDLFMLVFILKKTEKGKKVDNTWISPPVHSIFYLTVLSLCFLALVTQFDYCYCIDSIV